MKKLFLLLLSICSFSFISKAQTGEEFIGEIRMFAGSFTPKNYMACEGQILEIRRYQALFSILGNTYGGDGINTFALPDLRGKSVMGAGTGTGLSSTRLGEQKGTETIASTPTVITPSKTAGVLVPTSNTPVSNMQPYVGIRYIICVQGIYPPRN